jgi:hypothetical protein
MICASLLTPGGGLEKGLQEPERRSLSRVTEMNEETSKRKGRSREGPRPPLVALVLVEEPG